MKKYILLTTFTAFTYLIATSHRAGTGHIASRNCTGSYGSQNSCDGGSCHAPNSFDVVVDIELTDPYGNKVTDGRYYPGGYYKVKLHGYITNGTYPFWGYQFSASSEYRDGGTTFQQSSTTFPVTVGMATIMETIERLPTANNSFADSFFWQAPGPGAGSWTVYATVLGANGDDTRNGDKGGNYQRTLTPIPLSVTGINTGIAVNVFPNPAREQVTIKLMYPDGIYQVSLLNSTGQMLQNYIVNTDENTQMKMA